MNKKEFNEMMNTIDIYDNTEYNKLLAQVKHNICQNLRIARKITGMDSSTAADYLHLEAQSLRRIEAKNDRDELSTRVFITAIMIYKPDANFYFKDWKENELLLK